MGNPAWHVAINALLLSTDDTYRSAGVSGYTQHLLDWLPRVDDSLGLTVFAADRHYKAAPGIIVQRPAWSTKSPPARIAWEQSLLPLQTRRGRGIDLLHGTVYAAPLLGSCPTVVTVHDLTFVHHSATLKRFNRLYLRLITRMSAHRAARVIAVSESTRRELLAWLGLPRQRVVTVANGVDARFAPGAAVEIEAFRRQHGLPDRFILFLGTLEPRKNVVRLVEAFARFHTTDRSGTCLVIAGSKGWSYDQIFACVNRLGLQKHVWFPGYVPAGELPWWYRAAHVFVYPSVYEGFGLPVLEAMASGTAVITSNTSSLPEVAGDAAILVDPTDVEALAAALVRLLNDEDLRLALAAAGVRQAARFSWKRCAAETVAVYREALGLDVGPS